MQTSAASLFHGTAMTQLEMWAHPLLSAKPIKRVLQTFSGRTRAAECAARIEQMAPDVRVEGGGSRRTEWGTTTRSRRLADGPNSEHRIRKTNIPEQVGSAGGHPHLRLRFLP